MWESTDMPPIEGNWERDGWVMDVWCGNCTMGGTSGKLSKAIIGQVEYNAGVDSWGARSKIGRKLDWNFMDDPTGPIYCPTCRTSCHLGGGAQTALRQMLRWNQVPKRVRLSYLQKCEIESMEAYEIWYSGDSTAPST